MRIPETPYRANLRAIATFPAVIGVAWANSDGMVMSTVNNGLNFMQYGSTTITQYAEYPNGSNCSDYSFFEANSAHYCTSINYNSVYRFIESTKEWISLGAIPPRNDYQSSTPEIAEDGTLFYNNYGDIHASDGHSQFTRVAKRNMGDAQLFNSYPNGITLALQGGETFQPTTQNSILVMDGAAFDFPGEDMIILGASRASTYYAVENPTQAWYGSLRVHYGGASLYRMINGVGVFYRYAYDGWMIYLRGPGGGLASEYLKEANRGVSNYGYGSYFGKTSNFIQDNYRDYIRQAHRVAGKWYAFDGMIPSEYMLRDKLTYYDPITERWVRDQTTNVQGHDTEIQIGDYIYFGDYGSTNRYNPALNSFEHVSDFGFRSAIKTEIGVMLTKTYNIPGEYEGEAYSIEQGVKQYIQSAELSPPELFATIKWTSYNFYADTYYDLTKTRLLYSINGAIFVYLPQEKRYYRYCENLDNRILDEDPNVDATYLSGVYFFNDTIYLLRHSIDGIILYTHDAIGDPKIKRVRKLNVKGYAGHHTARVRLLGISRRINV